MVNVFSLSQPFGHDVYTFNSLSLTQFSFVILLIADDVIGGKEKERKARSGLSLFAMIICVSPGIWINVAACEIPQSEIYMEINDKKKKNERVRENIYFQ